MSHTPFFKPIVAFALGLVLTTPAQAKDLSAGNKTAPPASPPQSHAPSKTAPREAPVVDAREVIQNAQVEAVGEQEVIDTLVEKGFLQRNYLMHFDGEGKPLPPLCILNQHGLCFSNLRDYEKHLLSVYALNQRLLKPIPGAIGKIDPITKKETVHFNGLTFNNHVEYFEYLHKLAMRYIPKSEVDKNTGSPAPSTPPAVAPDAKPDHGTPTDPIPKEPAEGVTPPNTVDGHNPPVSDDTKEKLDQDPAYRPFTADNGEYGHTTSPDEMRVVVNRFQDFNKYGPTKPEPVELEGGRLANKSADKICFETEKLGRLQGKFKGVNFKETSVEELASKNLIRYLPHPQNAAILGEPYFEKDKSLLCFNYFLEMPDLLEADDPVKEMEFRNARELASKIPGIKSLSEETQAELKSLWAQGKTIAEKVALIEDYWIKNINYLENDAELYQKFFKDFPDAGLIDAACNLKQGNCRPKNFTLGISILQLSNGEVPVRFTHVMALGGNKEKGGQKINGADAHMQVEVLTPVSDTLPDVHSWKVIEASVTASATKEPEVDTKQAEQSASALEDYKNEIKKVKSISGTVKLTTLREITNNVHEVGKDAQGRTNMLLKGIDVSEEKKGQSDDITFTIAQTPDGKGTVFSVDGQQQKVPHSLATTLLSSEELVLFSPVINNDANEVTVNKTTMQMQLQKVGKQQYRRIIHQTIELPSGKKLKVEYQTDLNFAATNIFRGFEKRIDGVLIEKAVVVK